MEQLPGDYIAGFVDGEGCFALKFRREIRHNRKNRPVYFYWDIEFAINLKSDDKEVLEKIRDTLDCGRVNNANKRDIIRYTVSNITELSDKIVPFFERYPLHAKKRFDFELWKKAVEIFKRNQRIRINVEKGKDGFQKTQWSPTDLERLKEIREEMKKYKGGNRGNWKWL